jgi:ankyrin repeat protein
LYVSCQEGHVDIIEFLLENGADVNKQGPSHLSPLHIAIYSKQLAACKLILKYEQVSNQNIESGITMSRIAQASDIQALLEKALKKRRKVILVCFSFGFNPFKSALDTELAQKICCFCKQVPQKRYKCTRCQIAVYCSVV